MKPIQLDNLKSPVKWLVYVLFFGVAMSSPVGAQRLIREIIRYVSNKQSHLKIPFKTTQLSQAIYYLKKRKLIRIYNKNGKTSIVLTEKGEKKKLEYDLELISIPKQKIWDEKWRIVMFDIPEKNKSQREYFRDKLKEIGFLQFQESVWIYPYPCKDEINFISESLYISPYINLLTASIEDDGPLRGAFSV
ncbi:MAG: hypothetical protein WC705_03740 [Candidatus Paceibacterota bacterium]|jgi:DNA-binding transcriptional regulator PaaX